MKHLILAIILLAACPIAGFSQTSQAEGANKITLKDAPIEEALELYAQLSSRTVLQGYLPKSVIRMNAETTNYTEALSLLTEALHREHFATIMDGSKFVVVVPDSSTNLVRQILKSTPYKKAQGAQQKHQGNDIQAGMINMLNAPIDTAVDIYSQLIKSAGVEQNPDFPMPPLMFHLQTQTPLTKGEAIHAFDVVFALNGFKMIPATGNKIKPVPVSFK